MKKLILLGTLLGAFAFSWSRIVGGVEATPGEYPFIVSLQKNYSGQFYHICGATLVRKSWVLTAAHCVFGEQKENFQFVLGLHNISDQGEIHTAKDIFVDPNYDDETQDYDFALVHLKEDSTYKPLNLNHLEIPIDNEGTLSAITAGWGTLSEGGDISQKLMKVSLKLFSNSICNQGYAGAVTDRMLCAGYLEGGKDSCQGDSGGPLVYERRGRKVLIGVVSWGEGCARPNLLGVYSKVNSQIDWIISTIKENN